MGEQGSERLAAPQRGTPWPTAGEWLTARCGSDAGHHAPEAGCACGIHAWHPGRKSARKVLGMRWEIPGVVELAGAVEVHREGLRAERARPYALFVSPNANAARAERLAAAHRAQVVPVRGADEAAAWCRDRGLGLSPAEVERLLGPEALAEERRTRRHRRRVTGLKLGAVTACVAAAIAGGIVAFDPPDHRLFGRSGWVDPPSAR
ncbi:MAG: hypothetical protein ACAH82_11075 [Solirubrobacteraceae bacterium]